MAKFIKILRYASDLHLELRNTIKHPKLVPLWDFNSKPTDKYYLALLGDIGNPYQENLKLFLEKVSPKYQKIFYVPGNHEYYNFRVKPNKSKEEFDQKLEELCNQFDNIVYMNNKTYDLDGIKIIGSTLWSNVPPDHREYISRALNDYHLIKKKSSENDTLENITIDDTNQWNANDIMFIEKELNNTNNSCIIMTHHAPLFSDDSEKKYTADPIYLNSKNNYAFHNNLEHLLKPPVYAWLYGHTHYASKFKKNDVIIATNQLGYASEEYTVKYNPYAYLDLNTIELESL
ncbi:metallophosphoesterase-like protein [Tupanvirus deep ocean]|uniref:Metallophosphoesterase-like protein n=2 Tax=Tupanvirus TaxID=2094720 RepID=A0AC62A7W4_9VIRU|nr:metallophosphoesterase-like protein [Tupanvirus deep ocean]QKU33763.1 metallophosphoesterase-like protein [Tupanvirus deep ocean]